MRKTSFVPALLLICAVSAPAAIRVSVMGGYAKALEWSGAQDFGISAAAELDLADFLSLGARLTRASVPIPAETSSSGLSPGRLTLFPVCLFLQFRWPGAGRLKPYAAVGAGYSFNSHTPSADMADAWDRVGFAIEEKVDGSTAVFAGGGFDLGLGSTLFFTLHAQIIITPLSGAWTLTDTVTGAKTTGSLSATNGLNSVVAGIGLKYQF